jgi:ribulose bisphosphate carboxylase small subunit
MEDFLERQRTPENYWRAVIHFGQNVASYKFALAKTLIELSAHENEFVKLEALAEPFSRHMVEHLAKAPKQATSSSSRFLKSCLKWLLI